MKQGIGQLLGTLTLALVASACAPKHDRVWQDEGTYRAAHLGPPKGAKTGFTYLAPRRTGIGFTNTLPAEDWYQNRHLVNGSGVAIGDIDGDDWPDIFLARLRGPNALYINRGNWRFEEAAAARGVAAEAVVTTGAVLVDYDGDGDLDLLTTSLGSGTAAFANDGTGHFAPVTGDAGLQHRGGATSMALADIDGDRDLDLYVGYYKTQTVKDRYPPQRLAFERVVRRDGDQFSIDAELADDYRLVRQGERLMRFEMAEPDRFYLNDGMGRFHSVPATAFGARPGATARDWALTVRLQDLNGDGNPDLYVCNDFESPDHFWLGDGAGGFHAAPALAIRKTSQSTMSVAVGDVNADGAADIFLADMLSMDYRRRQRQYQVIPPEPFKVGDIESRPQIMQNMLLIGRGDGTFADLTRLSGVAASEWTWSSALVDVDLDGHQDLILTTGHAYDAMDGDAQMRAQGSDWQRQLSAFPPLDLHNVAFKGRGDGAFTAVPYGWGLGTEADVSHGMALGDLDRDGDLDVVISRLNAPAGVFRNGAEAPRIMVRLRGIPPNTQGIGAKVLIEGDGLPRRQAEIISGGGYLSSDEAAASFAVQHGAMLTVRWRSGRVSVIPRVRVNHLYEIYEQGATASAPAPAAPGGIPLMTAQTVRLVHQENTYRDFERQPLLPWRLSQQGPALVLADLDGDGDEDALLGGGSGQQLIYVLNEGSHWGAPVTAGPAARGDYAGIVVTPDGAVVAAVSNYEHSGAAVLRYFTDGIEGASETIDLGPTSPGPLVLADFDGDGQEDLFVGGRFVPGRYPQRASSTILRGKGHELVPDSAMSAPFAGLGLVSAAASGDLDGDGDADLVLATEWGPVRLMINDGQGRLKDQSARLNAGNGWWNGVALADFDTDGRLDIVATNWGTNTFYASSQPLVAWYGDLDRNGVMDILETRFEASLENYGMVRDLRVLSQAIPPLMMRVRSYREFSELSAPALLGSLASELTRIEVQTMQSMVFLQRDSAFEVRPLPSEAQWAPAFAPVVADFDGNGTEDLFLSQNFFAVPDATPRMDAGRGLMMLGDGQGGFTPLAGDVSGIKVYGEQRAAATADVNRDGRADLMVTQNAAPARFFLNTGAAPGLRVALDGPSTGAVIRLRYSDGTMGPARQVSAGAGYWSQHGFVQVMGKAREVQSVWVRWLQDTEAEIPVAPDASMVTVPVDEQP